MEENNEQNNLDLDKLKETIIHPKATYLNIKRVPKDTVELFKEFANEHYVGDYGMCLKFMVDKILSEDNRFELIAMAVEEHDKRICALEERKPEETKKIKTISGREIVKN